MSKHPSRRTTSIPSQSPSPTAARGETGSRAERKEETRQQILTAALALSQDNGLSGLSLRQVAREVGIVPTAFYRHFASIEELGLALVEESFTSLRAMIRELRQGQPELRGVIKNSVATLVSHVHARPEHFRFAVRERSGGLPGVRRAIAHELELFEHELATDLARLPGPNSWSGDDLRMLANLIVTAMVATVENLLTNSRRDAEDLITRRAEAQLRMTIIGAANWKSRP